MSKNNVADEVLCVFENMKEIFCCCGKSTHFNIFYTVEYMIITNNDALNANKCSC